MFTGIVEETGEVISLDQSQQGWRLVIRVGKVAEGIAMGDSLACNGCCLTVTTISGAELSFDLLDETVRLTSFAQVEPGALINLERSLAANGRFGGHIVSGHIDATGTILDFHRRGQNHYLRVLTPSAFRRYLVFKGSIAIDGMSLTVAEVYDDSFAVWLIPHTLARTNLQQRRVGDPVNLEFDLIAKYIERLVSADR